MKKHYFGMTLVSLLWMSSSFAICLKKEDAKARSCLRYSQGDSYCQKTMPGTFAYLTNSCQLNAIIEEKETNLIEDFNFNYKVDNACRNKWGQNLDQVLKDGFERGMSCLMKIKKQNKDNINAGIHKNIKNLQDLLRKESINITCSEVEGYDWDKTLAYASLTDKESISSLSIKHPFISINPEYPKQNWDNYEKTNEFQSTVFHEQFHNIGNKHGVGIEYAHACEECCFSNPIYLDSLSCKICSGNYPSDFDLKYLNDFMNFNFNNSLLKVLNTFKNGQGHKELFMILKKQLENNLNNKDSFFIIDVIEQNYILKDDQRAVSLIEDNLTIMSGLNKQDQKIVNNILKLILQGMWLDHFPSARFSNKASELIKQLK